MEVCVGLDRLCSELREFGITNQPIKGFEGEHLSSGGDEHLFHVLDPDAKASAGDAGDDLVFLLAVGHVSGAESAQVLDASNLVTSRAIVLGNFGFDDDLWSELVRDYEVGCLVEIRQFFCRFVFR